MIVIFERRNQWKWPFQSQNIPKFTSNTMIMSIRDTHEHLFVWKRRSCSGTKLDSDFKKHSKSISISPKQSASIVRIREPQIYWCAARTNAWEIITSASGASEENLGISTAKFMKNTSKNYSNFSKMRELGCIWSLLSTHVPALNRHLHRCFPPTAPCLWCRPPPRCRTPPLREGFCGVCRIFATHYQGFLWPIFLPALPPPAIFSGLGWWRGGNS